MKERGGKKTKGGGGGGENVGFLGKEHEENLISVLDMFSRPWSNQNSN